MAAICRRAGVAETTPSRWNRDKNGANLSTLKKLNSALDSIVAENASLALCSTEGCDARPDSAEALACDAVGCPLKNRQARAA